MLDRPIKAIGMHEVKIALHPEVAVTVKVNVARSPEEADLQAQGVDVMAQMFEREPRRSPRSSTRSAEPRRDGAEDAAAEEPAGRSCRRRDRRRGPAPKSRGRTRPKTPRLTATEIGPPVDRIGGLFLCASGSSQSSFAPSERLALVALFATREQAGADVRSIAMAEERDDEQFGNRTAGPQPTGEKSSNRPASRAQPAAIGSQPSMSGQPTAAEAGRPASQDPSTAAQRPELQWPDASRAAAATDTLTGGPAASGGSGSDSRAAARQRRLRRLAGRGLRRSAAESSSECCRTDSARRIDFANRARAHSNDDDNESDSGARDGSGGGCGN